MARLAMADLAEKTLDGQYYIWDGDTTGLILADRLLRAADRGVRVRLLIDDHYMTKAETTTLRRSTPIPTSRSVSSTRSGTGVGA